MVRKQVYIEPAQDARLKRRAADLGVTESELIRRGIDLVTEPAAQSRDEQAWEEEMAFILERARTLPAPEHGEPVIGRRWPREEMYEERWLRRFSP
jgi:hypothetical protein